jgi:hypothetical protein
MLLLGKNVAALTGYVMSWVRTAPGVIDTEISTVLDWRWLASPDDIVELCDLFFTRTTRERRQAAAKNAAGREASATASMSPRPTPTAGQITANPKPNTHLY